MTVVRITIKKKLSKNAFGLQHLVNESFATAYLVQTYASFPSPQLDAYALNIARAESRLYPACVRFDEAFIKLATPGATPEELLGRFSYADISKVEGQLAMSEDDTLAFPPVTAYFSRNAERANGGRLLIPHALTTAEWNLYSRTRAIPTRLFRYDVPGEAPPPSFGQELVEAVRAANGSHVMPGVAGVRDQYLRKIEGFSFISFQVAGLKSKRKKASRAAKPSTKSAKSREPVEGLVYLLKSGPHYKIGKTINLDKRLTQIRLQLPDRVEVVHTIRAANPLQAEALWHRRFASGRLNGEWFRLSEAEVEEFKGVAEM